MTLTLQRVAGQERRLHRVGQLVEVQDADALQLRDAVEVVVVGQDGPRRAAGASATSLASTASMLGDVLVGQLDRRCGGPSAARSGSPGRAGRGCARLVAVSAMCWSSPSDEARHDERAEQEAGAHDVGDAAVDERAGVDVGDAATRARRPPGASGRRPEQHAERSDGVEQVVRAWRRSGPSCRGPVTSETPSGSSQLYGSGRLVSGRPSSRPIRRPTIRPATAGDELAGRQLADAPDAASARARP